MKQVSRLRASDPTGHWDATGERKLMLAALEDALRTLLGLRHGTTVAEWRRKDYDWLTSRDRSEPFAFENICDVLGIDASYLRGRVLAAIFPSARSSGEPLRAAAAR